MGTDKYITGGNVRVHWRMEDIPYLRTKYHPGQRLTLRFVQVIGEGTKRMIRTYRSYKVAGVYPFHVGLIDMTTGLRESFGYIELERKVMK